MRAAFIALLLLTLASLARAQETRCAATLADLGRLLGKPAPTRHWAEVSMDDGKPLLITLGEHGGALRLEFVKTGAGLWAEISGVVCPAGRDLELRVAREQIKFGPASNWSVQLMLANGGVFALRQGAADQLQIETQGWSGRFVAAGND